LIPRERAEQIEKDFRAAILRCEYPKLVDHVEEAIKDFIVYQETPPKCLEHPKYKAKRKPRTTCVSCWKAYIFNIK
jgi:hypothetical protein